MLEENQTWESATTPPIDPPATPVVEPVAEPVVDPPAVAIEKPEAPQLEAEPAAARESETVEPITEPEKVEPKLKDDYVAEADDPPEIAALSTPAAKRWAKRQFQDAKPVRVFTDFDKPIQQFGDDLFSLSKSRYTEHVNDIFKRHSKDILGVPFEDIKGRLQPNGTPATTTTPSVANEVALPTEAELNEMTNEQVAQRFAQVQEQATKKATAEFQSKVDALQQQFDAVNGKLSDGEKSAQQREISDNQNKLLNNVLSVVDEVIRDSGLEVQPGDPPEIASLKKAGARLLGKQPVLEAFDSVDENQRLVKYVTEAINRKEYQNAFREEDNLKVRARTAAETVKQSPEVQVILSKIEAYANQSKTTRATNPIPPAPGSSLGVVVKPPTTWDEAVA